MRIPLTVVIVAAVVWTLALSGNGWAIPRQYLQPISIVATTVPLLLVVFHRWGWAWPGVNLLARRPDLRGTWKGVLQSTWPGDERSSGQGVIHAYITISQTYTGLHLRLFTGESQSGTLIAALACEADGQYVLSAMYRNQPRHLVRPHSPIHHGGLLLAVEGENFNRLTGSYWTDRRTDGEMRFEHVSRKRIGDFEAADAAFVSMSR